MRHDHSWNGTTYFVIVTAFGRRRFCWRFETANGLKGDGISEYKLHAAIEIGRRAAEVAINEAIPPKLESSAPVTRRAPRHRSQRQRTAERE